MEGDPRPLAERRLDQLRAGEEGVVILARVLRAERREVVRRSDGKRTPVLSGLLSDNSATVRFTWWDPPAHGELEAGTILRAGPVGVRDYRGTPELSFNWRTRFAEASEGDLPPLVVAELPARTLASVRPRDERFRLDVRVVEVRSKSVNVGATRRTIEEGIVGDATGTLAFTAWTRFEWGIGRAVRLSNPQVREFRGRPQLVLDERSRVDAIADGRVPALDRFIGAGGRTLGELEAGRGAEIATVIGRVVGLAPPSGLVLRCSECRRTVRGGRCPMHGAVTGTPDLRARVVLDDGTGCAVVNLERDETEREWGHPLSEAIAKEARGEAGDIEDALLARMLGRRRTATGRVVVDAYGATIYPGAWGPVDLSSGERPHGTAP